MDYNYIGVVTLYCTYKQQIFEKVSIQNTYVHNCQCVRMSQAEYNL